MPAMKSSTYHTSMKRWTSLWMVCEVVYAGLSSSNSKDPDGCTYMCCCMGVLPSLTYHHQRMLE